MHPSLWLRLRLPLLLRLKQQPGPTLGWGAQLPVFICGKNARARVRCQGEQRLVSAREVWGQSNGMRDAKHDARGAALRMRLYEVNP